MSFLESEVGDFKNEWSEWVHLTCLGNHKLAEKIVWFTGICAKIIACAVLAYLFSIAALAIADEAIGTNFINSIFY